MALTKVSGDFIQDGSITQGHLHASHGITTSDIGEGSNLYFTTARVDSRIGDLSTSNLSEGTNLYYTDARVASYLTTNNYATQSYVNTQVSNLVDSAPSTLDTLNELAAALGDDANFSTTVTNSIATKMPLAGGIFTGNVQFNDNIQLNFGSGADFKIKHNGTNSFLENYTGGLYIDQHLDDGDILFRNDDGSGGLDTYIRIDGSTEETLFLKKIRLNDNVEAHFGTARDLKIFHDGSNSYIKDTGAGNLLITSQGASVQINKGTTENMAEFIVDGAVNLYYDSAKKFETTSAGVTVTGTITASGYNNTNWDTAYTYSQVGHLPLAGGTLTGALQAQPWLFRQMSNQVEYHVLDNGSLNGPSWKFRYDGATANRWVDFGYKDGNGTYYEGLKLYNNSAITWKGNTMWHAGNDGSGSGLDADLLDGMQPTDAATVSTVVSRNSNGDFTGRYIFSTHFNQSSSIENPTIGAFWTNSTSDNYMRKSSVAHVRTTILNDTLATVTARGASTSTAVTFAKATFNTSSTGLPRQITIKEDGDTENSMGSYPGAWTSALNIQSNDASTYLWLSPLTSNIPRIQTNYGQLDFYTGSNTNRALHLSGTSARSEIFYDLNNTGYYANPASTSKFAILEINNGTTGNQKIEFKDANTSGYGALRFYYNNSEQSTIHVFGSTWSSSVWPGNSAGAINLSGYNGVTLGAWNNPGAWVYNSGQAQFQDSVRSPIFYDSNNTAYYIDPNSTGTSLKIAGGIQANTPNGNVIIKHTVSEANSWIFQENATNWGLFWMNEPITGTAFGSYTTVGAEFIGFRQGTATNFVNPSSYTGINTSAYAGWLLSNYSGYFWTAGTQYSAADMRAPIFYDSDNTGYYLNPNATSNLSAVNIDGDTRIGGTTKFNVIPSGWTNADADQWPYLYWHRDTSNGWDEGLIKNSSSRGFFGKAGWGIHMDSSRSFHVFSSGWTANFGVEHGGNAFANGQMRAPIFYDYNDTTYYVDPQSNTRLNGFVKIGNSSTYNSDDGGWGARLQVVSTVHARIDVGQDANSMRSTWYCHTGQSGSYFGTTTSHDQYLTSHNTVRQYLYNGWSQEASSYRAPIFYDSNDTTYYLDPNTTGTSLNAAGKILGSNINTDIKYLGTGVSYDVNSRTTKVTDGIAIYGAYSGGSNSPHTYDMSMQVVGSSRGFELSAAWWTQPALYIRTLRDCCTDWSSWYGIALHGLNPGTSAGALYAPEFYDSNDTGYYINPNSSSKLSGLKLEPASGTNQASGDDNVLWIHRTNNNDWGIQINADQGGATDYGYEFLGGSSHTYAFSGVAAGTRYFNVGSSYAQHDGSFRAPIFYDSNNTAYKADFADTGNSIVAAGSYNAQNYNKPALLLNASGTGSSGAAFGMQQVTAEGWTGVFVDYEPYTGWGLYHDNPNNYFCVTAESSTGNIRSFTVPSRSSGNRTSYEKIRFDQNNGNIISGGSITSNGGYLYLSSGNSIFSPSGGVIKTASTFYAARFYDYDNSTRYVDVSSTSYIATLHTSGTIQAGNSGTGNIYLGNTGVSGSGNHFRFHTNNSHTYFDGNCGDIHWRQGNSTRFYFYMTTANMTINGTLTQYSDERLKQNVVTIDNALNKVNQLRGVYYNRTDINTEANQIGLIAQETESVVPEVVHTANDELGTKSISYGQLNALLVEAIKEQQTIIDNLKSRIETLENQ